MPVVNDTRMRASRWSCVTCFLSRPAKNTRYTVTDVLKSGSRGTVYSGRDSTSGREVVIKRCKLAAGELMNLKAASMCDSALVQTLENQHLVDDRDIDFASHPVSRSAWLSVILTKNQEISVDPWISSRMLPLQPDTAAKFIVHYFLPVAELHVKTNLVHCDVKPDNFVVSTGTYAKVTLIDLEMAVPSGTSVDRSHGTPLYTSPEVVRTGRVTLASDAWALGVMLWQLFHPHDHPFVFADRRCGDSVGAMFSALGRLEYNPDTMWNSPDSLAADLCARLLHKDPAKRLSVINAINHSFFKSRDLVPGEEPDAHGPAFLAKRRRFSISPSR